MKYRVMKEEPKGRDLDVWVEKDGENVTLWATGGQWKFRVLGLTQSGRLLRWKVPVDCGLARDVDGLIALPNDKPIQGD